MDEKMEVVAKSKCNPDFLRAGLPAHIAQSVEHFLGKEEVTGSNPVVGSIVNCGVARTPAIHGLPRTPYI
jgi:hypothetical protein